MFEFILDACNGRTIDKIFVILVAILMAGLLSLVFYGLYIWIDSTGTVTQFGTATVTCRKHKDSWIQMVPMTIGKVTTMTPIHHPESWTVCMSTQDGLSDCVNVTKERFDKIEEGTMCQIEYRRGIFSGAMYIKEFRMN